LRVAGTLSLSGMRQTLDGHDLGFFRGLLAARAGVGVVSGVVDVDVTGGPALLVLAIDAHAEGRHGLASFAGVVGPHLSVTLNGPLAMVLGVDLVIAVTDERVTAGGATVAQWSRLGLEATLGLAWRGRWRARPDGVVSR
jgi:hypothetical protein